MALAAAGVGNLRCADPDLVLPRTRLLNPLFQHADTRAVAGRSDLQQGSSPGAGRQCDPAHRTDGDRRRPAAAVAGSDFAIGCVDQGMSNVMYRLNRACLQAGVRWTSGSVSAFEGIVGPTVTPFETACYLCYRMRAVACTENPEQEFAHLRFLDRRKRDDSGSPREPGLWRADRRKPAGAWKHFACFSDYLRWHPGGLSCSTSWSLPRRNTSCFASPGVPPVSRRRQRPRRRHDRRTARREFESEPGPLADLISPRTGIIRSLSRVSRGTEEPSPPVVCQSLVSQFDYRTANTTDRMTAGKGETEKEAMLGAIGEALERYCSYQENPSAVFRATAADLGKAAIPPR